MRKFLLGLLVMVAACRSVPGELVETNNKMRRESTAAFVVAEDTLKKIEQRSAELNDESVTAAWKEWALHVEQATAARVYVQDYLRLSANSSDKDVSNAYEVGSRLLADLDYGMGEIQLYWSEMVDPANEDKAQAFVAMFRSDIVRFNELQRKFDEWLKQFPVKDTNTGTPTPSASTSTGSDALTFTEEIR